MSPSDQRWPGSYVVSSCGNFIPCSCEIKTLYSIDCFTLKRYIMKLRETLLGVAVGSVLLYGCQNNSTKTGAADRKTPSIEELTNYPEADKQQLFFRMVEEVQTDSSVVYTVKSTFEEDTVGLKVEVLKNIQPGINSSGQVDADKGFVFGAIKLSSAGEMSDNFVKALGKMFKLPTDGKMTSTAVLP